MTIKEARQTGSNNVNIKAENSQSNFTGTLIGYTQNAVFIKNNNNINIITHKNGFAPCGHVSLLPSDKDIMMCGNNVGIKRGHTLLLFDEKGHAAGQRSV